MLELFLSHVLDFLCIRHLQHRNLPVKCQLQSCQIPFFRICIRCGKAVCHIFYIFCHHIVDGISHALSVQNTTSFLINDLSLLIHNLIVFQQILTDSKVIALDLLLCFLNRTGEHLMLDLFSVLYTQCVEYTHQTFRTKQTHQIILQRNIETGFSRISLSSGTSAQLVVNTSGFMTLCTDDLKTSGLSCSIIQLDIRTTSGHVGRNRDCSVLSRICHDFCFQFMILGIQYLMLNSFFFQHFAEQL